MFVKQTHCCKLMNTSVFGKTMDNVKNKMELTLTTQNEKPSKLFPRLNFKDNTFCDGLRTIKMYRKEIVYDKPIYVGTFILDLSKLAIVEYHYEVIHKKSKDNTT